MTKLTQDHIKNLVTHFYSKVQKDDLLGPIFNDVAQVDWDHHIPLICQFWNTIMLKTNEYKGNPYMKHMMLGKQTHIQDIHFARWLELFKEEAKKHLPPEATEEIVSKATMIAKALKQGLLNEKLM